MASEEADGGLMYQQLRKFINVIVSNITISQVGNWSQDYMSNPKYSCHSFFLHFLIFILNQSNKFIVYFRMSSAMQVSNNSLSCQGYASLEPNQPVRVLFLSLLSVLISCQEEMVSSPEDLLSLDLITHRVSSHGVNLRRCQTKSSLISRR